MTETPAVVSLTQPVLAELGAHISSPTYDRTALRAGIVHIGVGGFHRAHLATYAHELCAQGSTDWAIIGAGVLPADDAMQAALAPQDHLYTLITRGPEQTSVDVIGSLVGYIHAWPETEPLIERIAHPDTQIVSLTITEGGYPIDDRTGEYEPSSRAAGPESAFGILIAGLHRRQELDGSPLTILSCDNIMANGDAARTATLGEARIRDTELADWIESHCTFPNSMVDRITPATTDEDRHWLANTAGIHDLWPVVTEPFRQWVVEDRFAGARPPLEQLDVIVTHDVEPYELMKLRLLNAGHSCLSYLAALAEIETVDEALAAPWIHQYLDAFLRQEAQPVLPEIAGIDVDAYIDSLIERFSNPNIGDQISRLCLDGSAKFPKFLLPTVRAQIVAGGGVELAALALAGWCEYLTGRASSGAGIEWASDPMLDMAVNHAQASQTDPAAFLDFAEVFDTDLATDASFRTAFVHALGLIRAEGVVLATETVMRGARED